MPLPLLLVMSLSLLLASCTKPCRRADLESAAATCRVTVGASPVLQLCHDAGLSPPEQYDFVAADVEICDALGSGAFWECVAARCSEAAAAGLVTFDQAVRLHEECQRQQPPPPQVSSQPCASCTSTARTCRSACDLSSWETCADCDTACAIEEARCQSNCL